MRKVIIPLIVVVGMVLGGCNISKESWLVKPTFSYEDISPFFDYSTKAKVMNFTPDGIPETYGDFKYNDFFYYTEGGKRGIIDNKGEIKIEAQADVSWCWEGIVDNEHNVYDSQFNLVGPSGHGYEVQYYDIIAKKICGSQEGPMIYHDEVIQGKGMILPVIEATEVDAEHGEIIECKELGSYVMVYEGKAVTDTNLQDGTSFNDDGIAAIKQGDKWGFVDTSGKMIIDFKYDNAFNFNEGAAAVSLDGKWGYIRQDGSTAIKHMYDKTTSIAGGNAWVKKGGKWGYLNIISEGRIKGR